MTGGVSWEALTWVVVLVVVAGGVVSGFLLWLWSVVKGLRDEWDRDLADRDNTIKDLNTKVELADARAKIAEDTLARALADYRQHAGETFATKEGVTQAVSRVENAIDRLTGRIDRLLGDRAG